MAKLLTPEEVKEAKFWFDLGKGWMRGTDEHIDNFVFTINELRRAAEEAKKESEVVSCNECDRPLPFLAAHILCDSCLHSYIDN
jgi:hypothetical protein